MTTLLESIPIFFLETCPCHVSCDKKYIDLKCYSINYIKVIKIDIDKNPILAQKLNVRSVPTLAIYKEESLYIIIILVIVSERVIQITHEQYDTALK